LLLRGLLDPRGMWQPDLRHMIYAAALAMLILSYAYLVAQVTEARTGIVRRRLMQPWAARTREAVR